jgi:hypothetical protein
MLFRSLWLTAVWGVFLRRTARLPLHCTPCHPDGAGGLGFLGRTQLFFGPVAFAASSVVAGGFANLITYEGSSVDALKYEMIAFCIISVAVSAAPLLMLTSRLFHVKEQGLSDYHTLGLSYTAGFDRKWIIGGGQSNAEPLLGAADIQSLADLSNSFNVVRNMRVVLVDRRILIGLAIPAVLPMLVLLAAATPVDQLVKTVLRLVG